MLCAAGGNTTPPEIPAGIRGQAAAPVPTQPPWPSPHHGSQGAEKWAMTPLSLGVLESSLRTGCELVACPQDAACPARSEETGWVWAL